MNYSRKMGGHWGLFAHYANHLQNNPTQANSLGKHTSWEECVNEFDVETAAEQIASTGARWFGMTVHHGSEHFCCPNENFERITGFPRGSATVHRDLLMDLGLALEKRDVDLMIYHTGYGNLFCRQAEEALGRPGGDGPKNEAYYNNWFSVVEEDARRYGDLVKIWWMDGCDGIAPARLKKLSELLHSFNPDAAVALNYYGCARNYQVRDGIVFADWFISPAPAVLGEDYSAGETNFLGGFPFGWSTIREDERLPSPESAQWHLLAFLGCPANPAMVYDGWGSPGCKYDEKWLKQYRSALMASGGALTLDCCIRRDGTIDPGQLDMLRRIAY